MRKSLLALLGLLLLATLPLRAQTEWTPRSTKQLVNDYSGILGAEERMALEQRLIAFNDTTSNQIVIVITPTLYGDEIKAVGQRIGEQWGVGQKGFSNGLVILIKSKTKEEPDGEVAIVTGYGLEGAFPDIFCRRIIDDHMVEPLGEGHYYQALVAALNIIEPVAAGEYSYEQYKKEERIDSLIGIGVSLGIIVLMVVLILLYAKKHPDQFNGNGSHNSGSGGTFWMGTPGGSPRSFGGFGTSGGFGGFGGGHFGGGGASGKF